MQEVYISSDVAESDEERKRQAASPREKHVGEAAVDIGEHAPDFRPYPSTIDRADKILQLCARETVGREEAKDRTNSGRIN